MRKPLLVAAVVVLVAAMVVRGFPATVMELQRVIPANERVEISVLQGRDARRHGRMLEGRYGGVVDFVVQGSSDPYLVGPRLIGMMRYDTTIKNITSMLQGLSPMVKYRGNQQSTIMLYFTRVRLGTPPREYNVQIDTGSDILWINCNSCNDCPRTSGLGVDLNFYDNLGSSTANLVSCSDPICTSLVPSTSSQCAAEINQCSYSFQYGDGSGTSGFYVSDMFYFDMILGQSMIANSSASIVFGCSNYQSGDLTKSDRAIDGIFGFGQQGLSVVSQLSTRGITPRSFSHCLKGAGNGGGILVLGEILDPSIVYSPLVPSQPHYNLNLESIAVNGQLLPIDQDVFATSSSRGTIVDSGTTLAYLVEEAYDPFLSAVTAQVSQFGKPIIFKGNQCYLISASATDIFPSVSLNFAGGATMFLRPEEYLVHMGFTDGASLWCMGFQKVQEHGVTILGDLVLKDKIVVYDLARQRIGWANYDCSMSVNVSVTFGRDEFINAGQLHSNSSRKPLLRILTPIFKAIIAQIIALLIL